ncbi:MBL fold metallo-hydrolase [Clostridium brassicae]|uniref:MBL fold metallo-hydrolase n=1 Tax=Clostridium brassicae TaxID=2999072 RepID=A0ABT4DA75_9CLOT|nr:MBL fold metallo-hydrolase [Clostridium brassicae]MCY6959214.1 MBL fold metallo-hydrolase [Clostridium brassicae]
MKITWLGHSSFLIEDSKGRRLLTDPFDESVGYKIFDEEVDLVSISHHHFDHDYIDKLKGNPKIIDKVGLFNLCDIPLKGIPSFHDDVKGTKRGENIIFVFEIDGYKICHLGDLGHELSQDYINKIGNIDILLIPVGGNYTIDGKAAAKVAKEINSKIIIPMHYKTPHLSFPLEGVETFIINMENGERINNCSLIIDKNILDKNTVKILDPRE